MWWRGFSYGTGCTYRWTDLTTVQDNCPSEGNVYQFLFHSHYYWYILQFYKLCWHIYALHPLGKISFSSCLLFYQEREKKNDSSALRFLSAGLGDIAIFKKQLKASDVQIDEDTELASTVAEILFLREKMTSQLEHLRCEGTLRTLDLSVLSLFTSTVSNDNFSVPSFSTLLLPHIEEPSVLLKRALIIAAECSWDAQLWSLRNQGSEVQHYIRTWLWHVIRIEEFSLSVLWMLQFLVKWIFYTIRCLLLHQTNWCHSSIYHTTNIL